MARKGTELDFYLFSRKKLERLKESIAGALGGQIIPP